MLCSKIEDAFATVFRQNVLTRFEQAAHAERRKEKLTSDQLCELWWGANETLYGGAVEMLPLYRWGWAYIPHFIHTPFYCYAYVFGELLVLSLYRMYGKRGRRSCRGTWNCWPRARTTPRGALAQGGSGHRRPGILAEGVRGFGRHGDEGGGVAGELGR